MFSWTDTYFRLTAHDKPIVTSHADAVSFHRPGCDGDGQGRGFCLMLTRHHLAQAKALVAALEASPPLPSERDADPFADSEACGDCGYPMAAH